MKVFTFLISQFLLLHVISLLPDKTRSQLFLKYAKEISIDLMDDEIFETYLEEIPYNKTKIAELIKEYDFPESYNFPKKQMQKSMLKIKKVVDVVGQCLQLLLWPIDTI